MADRNRTIWTVVALTAGAAAGFWLWRRGTERAGAGAGVDPEPRAEADIAARVEHALRDDIALASRDVRVKRVSDGVVELTGRVADGDQSERAVATAQAVDDVHTVVNRLTVAGEEARREAARKKHADTPIRHTGMGVGMGTRRQSPETDPDRPSDRQKLVDRELDVDRMERQDGEPEP